ncbi:Cytochrome b-c1 complex subunit 8 [Pleurotus pulmonarius]|nr:ubiquinol--cytochrome-c reductase subunit 8 [Pleurotus pulmonarius]
MRVTSPRLGDMPGPKTWNVWWGDKHGLVKQRGVIQYTISSTQSSPTRHIFRGWLFNGTSRLAAQAPYFVVPFAIGYGIYAWAHSYDDYHNSKAGHIADGGHH